jgi:signal transduction histidine kinase
MPAKPAKENVDHKNGEVIPFKMHPRVFQALGSELVTSDVVAIIELVKNAYDAFAREVKVRFVNDPTGALSLEIEDNGVGMTQDIIDDVWCVVATPYRQQNPVSHKDGKDRRTTGAKGLGRLSVARLGDRMRMITHSANESAWEVDVDWSDIAAASELAVCHAIRKKVDGKIPFKGTGTVIRIFDLKSQWTDTELAELEDGLSRLISPFKKISDFKIYFNPPGSEGTAPVEITPSEFLNKPIYLIKGNFSGTGRVKYEYKFAPYTGKARTQDGTYEWAIVQSDIKKMDPGYEQKIRPSCGPFDFEIRVWELDKDSMAEAEKTFETGKSKLRSQIKAFKGISLYRDGVLVLPKSDSNRDWLGLDLRRVSKVGSRLSTSQIVGYISISADDNPGIIDTSDRERLARTVAVVDFERVVRYIVSLLEMERARDEEVEEPKLQDVFEDLSPRKLVEEVEEIVSENGSARDVLPLLASYSKKVDKARAHIQRQFIYYNRLAAIGTISQMLVHEVGNNSVAIGAFLRTVKEWIAGKSSDRRILEARIQHAEKAIETLSRLAETFRPLANRSFERGKRVSSFSETIEACVEAVSEETKQHEIKVTRTLKGPDAVKIDPGELYPVFYNLIDNAIYWLAHQSSGKKLLEIKSSRSRNDGFLTVNISDSGPGISAEDGARVFLPGVTRKPNGSGMGLPVAAEILGAHNGSICLVRPGLLGGATFRCELPVKE